MATIYEIDEEIRACCERVDEETGELLDPDALDALQMEREAKLEGVALYIKQLTYDVANIKSEEKVLSERRQAKERRVERLKAYLADALNGEKLETSKVFLSCRNSKAVIITDKEALIKFLMCVHDECLHHPEPEVDKAKLRKVLKSGVYVPGAELESRRNLQIK